MGTELTRPEKALATLTGKEFEAQVAEVLPPGVALERFMRTAKSAIHADPDLLQHDSKTLFASIVRCAGDGLLPDGREAALVVYKGKVQYLPMVTGLRKRAAEFGFTIAAYVVFEHDFFRYQLGYEPMVEHVPPPLGEDRGAPVGAYAVATDRAGRRYLEPPMSRQEIEKVRAVSKSGKSEYGPWVNWWEEMARKTVARRLFKSLPLHDESVGRLLDSVDHDYDPPPEQKVDRAIGYVGPPPDTHAPDDSIDERALVELEKRERQRTDEPDVIEGHAVLVEDSEEEPEAAQASPSAESPPVAPAASPPAGEPGSSSENPSAPDLAATPTQSGAFPEGNDGESGAEAQGSIFEQKAAAAQARRKRGGG